MEWSETLLLSSDKIADTTTGRSRETFPPSDLFGAARCAGLSPWI